VGGCAIRGWWVMESVRGMQGQGKDRTGKGRGFHPYEKIDRCVGGCLHKAEQVGVTLPRTKFEGRKMGTDGQLGNGGGVTRVDHELKPRLTGEDTRSRNVPTNGADRGWGVV